MMLSTIATAARNWLCGGFSALFLLTSAAVVVVPCHASAVPRPVASQMLSTIRRGGSLQSRRWERMDGKALSSSPGSSGSDSGLLQSTLQSAAGGRACGYFIWDAPSALLHRWCHHLLKDCVYEGLGGRKFVRIEPGSVLQLLYPCSRYSSNRCLLCGGTYQDHLTLWWAKNMYTPLDQSLEQTYQQGLVLESHETKEKNQQSTSSLGGSRSRTKSRKKTKSYAATMPQPPTKVFAFHRRYVTDVNTLVPAERGEGSSDATSTRKRNQKLHQELTKMRHKVGPMEVRMLLDKKVAYVVPTISTAGKQDVSKSNHNQQQPQRPPSILWRLSRTLVLGAMDQMIHLQEMENQEIRRAEQSQRCCH